METFFTEASDKQRKQAILLLEQAQLPTKDIDESVKLFVLQSEQEVIGTGGLEQMNDYGLLRSVSVKESEKGRGFGQKITQSIENYAKLIGIKELYLLTNTAKDFFDKKENYEVVNRDLVPKEIQESTQFAGICPSSATVMRKKLV
ncbi:arsenic resistance N-acetyltransferase ArsN2 [Emticicia sp. SJ17W-69]|uniref:arsenic resistance N-acetyltransferase ArsN2 n=1 Tax=Emticicia sp. SJ17W-69 TaxID=3421657 RepID=UPI003EBBC1B4